MLRSSLGFHTLTVSYPIFKQEMQQLISDFKRYSKETGAIQMYSERGYLKIEYCSRAEGISWLIRPDVWHESFGLFIDILDVTINPKILGGIHDYITAATYDDMTVAIANFNRISASISPLLGTFEHYTLTRIDYCINFALNELAPDCTHEQMINLIRRADIPPHYKEWNNPTSIQMRTSHGSFYLMNGSVHINCYSKYVKLREQTQRNIKNGYPPIPQVTMDSALDIIRFEVQCKPRKVYALSRKDKKTGRDLPNMYEQLLTREVCNEKIDSYYKRTIGRGDWYTLQEAIRMVQSHHFNSQKEDRLIRALRIVNDYHSVAKAKAAYQGRDLEALKRSLSDLANLRINPVTIPREWGIKHIPNLLYAYFDKVFEEELRQGIEAFKMECLKEALHA